MQPKSKKSGLKNLIIIDETPIRKKHMSAFRKTQKDLKNANKDLEKFTKEDQPFFTEWYRELFKKELQLLHDEEAKAKQLESIINRVEHLRFYQKVSYKVAYQHVKNNTNPENEQEPKRENYSGKQYDKPSEDDDDFFRNHDEPDMQELFEEFLDSNPFLREYLKQNKKAYKDFFEEFKQDFEDEFGSLPGDKGKHHNVSTEEQIKAKYRTLVRKLHPDYRKINDSQSEELWHEVQKAYAEKNLERLEVLHALCSIHLNEMDAHISVSQLIGIIQDYKSRLKEVKNTLKNAKKDTAWDFSNRSDKELLKSSIFRSIQSRIKEVKECIKEMEKRIRLWENNSISKKRA